MAKINTLEVWQRGAIPEVPALLQPVAHALLQAREELEDLMADFPAGSLWQKPFGMASCGFHLQHLSGVIDRLFTYARNGKLDERQFAQLAEEKEATLKDLNVESLVQRFSEQVDAALKQLSETDENSLTDFRAVGRAGLPSTVLGLLFHAAEHTMRHLGQLMVTAKVVGHVNS